MKTSNPILLAFAMLLTASTVSAATVRDHFKQTYSVQPGGELAVWNVNGSISIEAWDRPEVLVEAEKVVKSNSRRRAEAAMEDLRIRVDASSHRVAVTTETPKGSDGLFGWLSGNNIDYSVTYRISVPREFDLDVETTNGGIETRAVRGRIEVDSTNGKILVYDAAGSLDASTTNGSIEAELREVEGSSMRLGTTNGRITIRLPEGVGADIDASTTNGSIESEFPVTTTTFRRTKLNGSINGGGPAFRLRTTNGSIRIERLD